MAGGVMLVRGADLDVGAEVGEARLHKGDRRVLDRSVGALRQRMVDALPESLHVNKVCQRRARDGRRGKHTS